MLHMIKLAIVATVGLCTMLAPHTLLPLNAAARFAVIIALAMVIHVVFQALDPKTHR